uniref:NADH-ubiquinone oxidoreductase chain 5 n=1 Tax=Opilio parietinus TaxID=121214 RepID=E3UHH3_9ARAC|nr:NADH dehydrogenase subunit 5 [Opilio parietinus]ADI92914.1 NADH dehydrogenase subunit 5 [Opilio parietinus]
MSLFMVWAFFLMIFFFFFFFFGLYLLLFNKIYLYEYELFSSVGSGGFLLVLDWLGVVFFSFVLLISSSVFVYSNCYMSEDSSKLRFIFLVLLFIFSMGLLVLSPNLMSLLLGWDGLGLISYGLVIYYQNTRSFNAGMITVLSNRVGDVGILLGIVGLVNLGGWTFIFLDHFFENTILFNSLFCCIILAAMTKSAQLPFSSWLPAAMAAPTPVSSLVHSSTLVTAGVFLLIRFHDIFININFMNWLMYISLLTLVMSGVGACLEMDFKKVIALSTLSQLALMMFSLSIGMWEVAYFHMLTHAIFKALLFLCAGSLIHSVGGIQDIRVLGGVINFSPMLGYGMLVSFLSLGGIPFSCGFYLKDMVIEMYLMGDKIFFFFLFFFLGIFSTLIYIYRLIYNLLLKAYGGGMIFNYSENIFMNISVFMLGVFGIFFGSAMSWLLFDYSNLILLSSFMKLMTLAGVIFLLWFLLNNFFVQNLVMFLKMNIIFMFFSTMWFLSNLSSMVFSWLYCYLGFLMVAGEVGWGEMLGGKGFSKLSIYLGGLSQKMQYNFLSFQVVLFFLIFLYFLIL